MKSILAGFSIPGFLEPRTLVAKVLGVVLLLGAGLPIGKEGPFIHTVPTRRPVLHFSRSRELLDRCTRAAILAELLMRVPFFARHTNELFRNQMLSAAAAVGVSAAFGAPIGGILFSIEATANYYATSHYWGAFLCATVGAFTSRELAFKSYGAFSPHFDTVSYKHWEVGIFLLLSALCGILGGFFVTLFTAFVGLDDGVPLLKMKGVQAIPKIILGTNLGFSALVALTSGLFACWIGDFALLGTREVMDDLFSEFPLREDANPKLPAIEVGRARRRRRRVALSVYHVYVLFLDFVYWTSGVERPRNTFLRDRRGHWKIGGRSFEDINDVRHWRMSFIARWWLRHRRRGRVQCAPAWKFNSP